MAETTSPTKTCSSCGREVRDPSRGMCGNCYRIWQRENFPPNATCEVCGRDYFRRPCASPSGRSCSRECFTVWKRGRDWHNRPTDGATLIDRSCEWCGRPFAVEKRQVDKGFGRFCSLECSNGRRAVPRLLISCERCSGPSTSCRTASSWRVVGSALGGAFRPPGARRSSRPRGTAVAAIAASETHGWLSEGRASGAAARRTSCFITEFAAESGRTCSSSPRTSRCSAAPVTRGTTTRRATCGFRRQRHELAS